jgi:opacity protein-like surface antigen
MKKSLIATAAFAAILQMPAAHAGDFDGAFIGLKAGDNLSRTEGNAATDQKNAGTGGVEAGYLWTVDPRVLVGFSTFYDYNGRVDRTLSSGASTKYGSNDFGADAIVGTPLDKFLIYGKLGLARVQGKDDASGLSHDGFLAGVGVDYALAPTWTVGAEWTDARASEHGTKLANDNFVVTVKYHFDPFAKFAN